jgi:hypothetical protein
LEGIVAAVPGHTLVLVDLNDTLVDDRTGQITAGKLELQLELQLAEEAGITVGLCSDSPYDPMVEWAEVHGVKGPIVAEGGLVVFGEALVEIDIAEIHAMVNDWCTENSLTVAEEPVLAIEFGGQPPTERPCLAFGYGRMCSVSMFTYNADNTGGLTDEVRALGTALQTVYGTAVDVNLIGGMIIVHHEMDFRDTKKRFLTELGRMLNAAGKNLVMVGNSRSDVVGAPELCYVIMVGNCTSEGRAGADYMVQGEYTAGVIQALDLVKTRITAGLRQTDRE